MMTKFLVSLSRGFCGCMMGLGKKCIPPVPFFIACSWARILSSSLKSSCPSSQALCSFISISWKPASISLNKTSPWRANVLLSSTITFHVTKSFSSFEICCWRLFRWQVFALLVTPTTNVSFCSIMDISICSKLGALTCCNP